MSVIMIINVVSITLISFWCPSPKKFKNKHKNTIILSSLAIQFFFQGENVKVIREKHNVQIWIEDPRNNSTDCRWGKLWANGRGLKKPLGWVKIWRNHLGIYWHVLAVKGNDGELILPSVDMSRIRQGDGLWIHRESGEIGAGWIGIYHGFLAATKGSRSWVGGKQLLKKKALLKDY